MLLYCRCLAGRLLSVAGGSAFALLFQIGNNQCAASVTGNVHSGTAHVEDPVDARHQSDALNRKTDRGQHHCQHDHTGAGDTGGTNGGQRCGQHLGQCQLNAVAGGNKDSAHALINGGAIHIDGSAERQHKGGNFLFRAQFFGAAHIDGQRTHRGGTGEGKHDRGQHALKEGEWRRVVDSWQNQSTALLESPILYVVLVILVAAFVGRKLYILYRQSEKKRSFVSSRAVLWVKRLDRCEKELAKVGFRRETGETVGCFLRRLDAEMAKLDAPQDSSKSTPNRRKIIRKALEFLRDYEMQRWRV